MPRNLLYLIRRRFFWLALLVTVWLFCSGEAQASPLTERLKNYPHWTSQPTLERPQGDLVYPAWMKGTWQLTTTLVDLAAPLAPDIVTPGFESNHQYLQQPVSCTVRFLEIPTVATRLVPRVTGQSQIVADRAFNGLNLAQAYLGESTVNTVKVDPQNPNRQITLLAGKRQLESTVIGRATEHASTERFISTELFQQVFRGTARPYLNQVETTTDYHQGDQTIWADQVTAVYLAPQDADYFKARNQPVALYRYHLDLTAVSG
jgi:hypothetical protein